MNKHACSEEHVLYAPKAAGLAHLPAPAKPFPRRRAHYFTQARKQLLTEEQQQALIKLISEGNVGAKQTMIAQNMHLVVDFAKHFANRGLAPLDLIREGNLGLIHALEEFEPEGDFSFLAYATWCICQNIELAIMSRNNSSCRRASISPVVQHVAPSPMHAVLSNKALDNIGGGSGFAA